MATAVQTRKEFPIVRRGEYRLPPGLKLNLPFYLTRKFFKPGDPIKLFEYLQETYGSMSHYRIANSDVFVVHEPEFIREILVNQADKFIKERTQKRMKILLGNGLITSDGEFHKRQRRIAAPAFHRQRIQAYGAVMTDRALAMREEWQPGKEIGALAEMMRVTLQIVARTLLNTDVTAEVQQINDEVNAIMDLYNFLVALPRAEAYLHWPIPGLMRFRRARKRLDAVVYRIIAEHRQEKTDGGDLLSMLLRSRDDEADHSGMTDEQVRDEILTIFLAGYETVATALTWTWYLLAQNPEAEARMHEEIDTVLQGRTPTLEDLPQLKYVEMVFAESMRLYPPAWAMGRQATADVELGPYRLPAGSYVFFSQYIIQRNPEYWPDPLEFRPERFSVDQKAARSRFIYFPFGAGSRQCIGESFAWMEGVLVLATIAQKWRLRLIPGQQVELQPKITLRPKPEIRMLLELR
ncbi:MULTISPECIES: cytochrome P450 [Acidobacterium]|uniref:Cytochrome P450 family protein n=1 Tax=Acidobacterium capsulatum (strain ATCC 51196 / DSM 11244 / BCRC 80197 / JCM 7670 / NBRC 15755 / NCIMB 13165 / 161) TaxID=240015 RepID=C1F4E6_ACIC5|nr:MULTISPECIES: cytochrome P450 [Acidobacterium]ACO33019.1 cytochrome P450 family protein [Acidobacterium capsulatum ATCC 51196]HCT61772.1 cytochrome P450 [Acidobacterium sp.]